MQSIQDSSSSVAMIPPTIAPFGVGCGLERYNGSERSKALSASAMAVPNAVPLFRPNNL